MYAFPYLWTYFMVLHSSGFKETQLVTAHEGQWQSKCYITACVTEMTNPLKAQPSRIFLGFGTLV